MTAYAHRLDNITGEAVATILRLMRTPGIISFGGGNPSPGSFPAAALADIAKELLDRDGISLLQYGIPEGLPALRKAVADHVQKPRGLNVGAENIMVTSGSQQVMDLVCATFLDPGDTVLVEAPTFLVMLQTFTFYGANIVAVPMDEEGVDVVELEKAIKKHQPKVFYTIPTFQNPTGRTLGVERRKAVARLAAEYDVLVIEDDPYYTLRYRGEALPPIKAFDEAEQVILANSFSKAIAPGLRVGCMVTTPERIKKLCIAKQCNDTNTANLDQAMVAEYLNRGMLPPHLKEIIPDYAKRCAGMLEAIKAYFPSTLTCTDPQGGLFIWGRMPGQDMVKLAGVASEKYGVAFVPGEYFFPDPENHKDTFRLNFSGTAFENIEAGIKKLGELFSSIS